MREPRVYVGAVVAIVAFAGYLQLQPPAAGPPRLRTIVLPTASPTPIPTPEPTEDPFAFQILRYVNRYGGTATGYREMITGDCSTLRAHLNSVETQMAGLESGMPDWLLAYGYTRAITWRLLELHC